MIPMILQRFSPVEFAPLHPLALLRQNFDSLFAHAPSGPAIDVFENEESLVVNVEVPGLKKEDISISLEDGVLFVSGERKPGPLHETATVCRCETALGKFERQIGLPYKVDADKITAAYHNGILTVTLPKAEEAKSKQIPINN